MNRYRNCNCSSNQRNNNQMITSENINLSEINNPPVFPSNYMYGQSYVPIQYMNKTFKPDVGLQLGTIFPELVSPYSPGQSMEEIAFIGGNQ